MRTLKAAFLLIGPWEPRLQEHGAHIATDLSQALHWIQDSVYDVVALSVTLVLGKNFPLFFQEIKRAQPATQFIVVVPADFSSAHLAKLHEQYSFHSVLERFNDLHVETTLFSALEESNQQKQNQDLELLVHEQTTQLKKLQVELEERVQKRAKFLTEARRKLFQTNSRIESFRKALTSIHEASSISEIETHLNESLINTVQASWIRIFFQPQDELFAKQIKEQLDFSQLQIPLYKDHFKVGSIFFLRNSGHNFNKEEQDFLNRVAEAVALALDRIHKLNESESLKEQWEATFSSMSEPVLIIDTNYDVIQSNFLPNKAEAINTPPRQQKCYEVLYKRDKPCGDCQRGYNFQLQSVMPDSAQTFEVFSQSLLLDPEKPPVFVNLYHDVTQRIKMERQILETAKMAELGTIGSSIAHELNNPLGGILSFTQLIRMDMDKNDALYPDVVEMEAGVQRCKEIVQNLLGFTRDPHFDKESVFNLSDLIHRALKIVELQSKSLGISLELKPQPEEFLFRGHLNLLAQALKNILQVSIDRLQREYRLSSGFKGRIEISWESTPDHVQIIVFDNAPKEKKTSVPLGIGLSVASQILRDHQGSLELSSHFPEFNRAIITLPRPVLGA